MKFNQRTYTKKFNFLGLGISIVFLSLIAFSFRLQVINHKIYNNEVITNTIKQRKLPAPRGNIVDKNGILLASNIYQNDLYMIPYYFSGDINLICEDTRIDCASLELKIHKYPLNRILIAKNISDELAKKFKDINGLFIFRTAKRLYNIEAGTTHIVGYIGKINRSTLETNEDSLYADDDYIGQVGLENIYDHEIHGVNGYEKYVRMANGLELKKQNRFLSAEDSIVPPIKGNNLVLSIDDRLQMILANSMVGKKGAGVVLDIRTGTVLAMYSNPSYDPNNIKDVFNDVDHPLINRAISSYAPGSTFKLVTALAALEMGVIDEHTKLQCHGTYYFGGRAWHCWKHTGHGSVDMRDAIKHSCDIYFYQLAQKVGLDNINKYARMLGIGEFTGIDLDVESAGKLPTIKRTSPGVLLNTVIGQGIVQITPLQLANAYVTMLNGGKLYSPRLTMNGGQPIIRKNNNFKQHTIDFLMDALYAVVNEPGGTAYMTRSRIVEVSGKTGTAQTAGLDKKKKDNAWFVGYYPVVEPQIVVCVFVESGEHGSSVASIAFRIVEEYSKEHAPLDY